MGRKRRIFGFATLLSVLLAVPLVFGLGIVDVPKFSFGGSSSTVESASSASVFVDPAKNITDYEDPIHNVTIGSTVIFNINISGVFDLFTWNINITWNPDILNFSRVKEYGTFLRATTSLNGTSGWINRDPTENVTIAPFNNTAGYAAIAETILDSSVDAPGVDGSGRLVTLEFLIVGYGCTNLTISESGTLPTKLLNSTGSSMDFDPVNGYFRNKLLGDTTADGLVDVDDVLMIKSHRTGPPPGPAGYDRNVDITDDGIIDVDEVLVVKANRGRSVALP